MVNVSTPWDTAISAIPAVVPAIDKVYPAIVKLLLVELPKVPESLRTGTLKNSTAPSAAAPKPMPKITFLKKSCMEECKPANLIYEVDSVFSLIYY